MERNLSDAVRACIKKAVLDVVLDHKRGVGRALCTGQNFFHFDICHKNNCKRVKQISI